MDSFNSNATSLSQLDLDSIMGTTTRIPRLMTEDGFPEWKFRFENYMLMKEPKAWRSITRGPTKHTITFPDKTTTPKPLEQCSSDELDLLEIDDRATACLFSAIAPHIAQGFRGYKVAKELWEALIAVYEGNEDMQQSRQDLLRQRFNLFNHIIGETLEMQLQRFIALTTEMHSAGVSVTKAEINKKLLNSLPKEWNMNVAVIKSTRNLKELTLAEVMAIIKSYDMDSKQREINHVNSYSTANLGVSSNSAFAAQPAQSPSPQPSPHFSIASSSTTSVPSSVTATLPKDAEEVALVTLVLQNYHALLAGRLASPLKIGELD